MKSFLIRNDDVSTDTRGKYLDRLKDVCSIADKYHIQMLQAITPMGNILGIDSSWDNDKIRDCGWNMSIEENEELIYYLLSRKNDLIGVHGLYHTHVPTLQDIQTGKQMLIDLGFNPTYFVTPFNEGEYPETIAGLKVSAKCDSLETLLNPKRGMPKTDIVYLHSWRFNELFTYDALERAIWRILTTR